MSDKQLTTMNSIGGVPVPVVPAQLEQVLLEGNLGSLSPEQKIMYYKAVCDSVGLNPLTKPFEYLKFQGKEILYPAKGCAEQLRKINGVSLSTPNVQNVGDLIIVSITGTDKNGRTDTDCGVLNSAGLRGDALANATMKAITKAKRRVTLSICGLGMADISEDDIDKDAAPVVPQINIEAAREEVNKREAEKAKPAPDIDGPIYNFEGVTPTQWGYLQKSVFPKFEHKQLSEHHFQFRVSLGEKFAQYFEPPMPDFEPMSEADINV